MASDAYREFYDLPRAVLVDHEGKTYFFDCPFDDELDEYPDEFAVHLLPTAVATTAREPEMSSIGLSHQGTLVGRVKVNQVHFDGSMRRFLDSDVFALLNE